MKEKGVELAFVFLLLGGHPVLVELDPIPLVVVEVELSVLKMNDCENQFAVLRHEAVDPEEIAEVQQDLASVG